ncbi:hypothetical protein [Mucilaginibacter flavus]|uniref:hypothetical protein n=1 Tax=Mucilaginibacter flavus TaxID=931504 RepID=UPI0025B46ED2|nr:hypothetical protein [Mucilaginibacter flavus]MDN3581931.1 hypothetical protein [Mucilaginibacter flavus]
MILKETHDCNLKQGATHKEIKAVEKQLFTKNAGTGFNAKKYNGIFKAKEDPTIMQTYLRGEWERNQSL